MEVNTDVYSKQHMINLMKRSDFYLCSDKSGFITNAYMTGVRFGKIHCPKYSDVRMRACPDPPTKLEIVQALMVIC